MPSKPHESVKLVDFQIVYFPVKDIGSFEDQRNALQFRSPGSALIYFTSYNGQITPFNCQDERMVKK